jgi:hypothetical protein
VVDVVETRRGMTSRNAKTWWISMLQLAKRVLGEYRDFILKMDVDKISNNYAMKNVELLYDCILC